MKLSLLLLAAILISSDAIRAQMLSDLTPESLRAALAAKPSGAEAQRLADRVRAYFGGREALIKGAPAKIDELTIAWAVELGEPLPANEDGDPPYQDRRDRNARC